MKKIILALTVVVSTFSLAQESKKSSSTGVTFGAKAGLNISTINTDDAKSKAGFYGGVFANIPVATVFSVQPEVMYSAMGAKTTYNSEISLHLDYITVPVMFQYNILPEFYVEAGPQFGFAVNKKLKAYGVSANIDEAYSGFDFGVGLGAGYYFMNKYGITARYVAGTSDIYKNNDYDAVKNSVFQIGLAYKF